MTSPDLGKQMLSMADSTHAFTCNEQYALGSFYEIDHDKLPPKSPIQLKAIRIVMVSEETLLDVTVSFPSKLSLRSYFASIDQISQFFPNLDEKFVMSSNQARRILRRRIPSEHLQAETPLKSFWLLHPLSFSSPLHSAESDQEDDETKNNEYKKSKKKKPNKERWSIERYDAAEKQLIEIMKRKKAEIWTPVLRQTLRDEARKQIGDTGLLDHLLKHMEGKIVSDGKERFRRSYNSNGFMEFWIEPADLVEIRRNCDSIFPNSSGFDCKVVLGDLKQQVAAQYMRYDEQQNLLMKLENEAREMKVEAEKVIAVWQEKCHILFEQITKQKGESVALFDCLRVIKEHVQSFKANQKPEKKITGAELSGGFSDAKKQPHRSGFTICKPHGTFLWPNDVSCASHKQHVMIFPFGGPPSASSSTAFCGRPA